MVTIDKLYKTKIDCSTYEPQIDSDDVFITVTLLDFNNVPVPNESVTVTVDKGKIDAFTRQSSNNDWVNVNAKTTTVLTNNNGYFTLKYVASEWGFVSIQANNMSVKLFVSGWKKITEFTDEVNYHRNYKTYNNKNYTDPFPTKYVRYDDSIGVAVFRLTYNGKWAKINSSLINNEDYYIFHNSTVTLAQFLDDSANPSSNLPHHIFLTDNGEEGEYQYNLWYRPSLIYWINNAGEINIRAYNRNSSDHSTVAGGESLHFLFEKYYQKEGTTRV